MRRTIAALVATAVVGASIAGCSRRSSDDDPGASATSTSATTAPTTTSPTSLPPSTEPPMTEPSVTEPSTTVAPPTGWTLTTFDSHVYPLYYSGNWEAPAPSPPPPAPGDAPANAYYVATLREPWSSASPDVLAIRVHRLERCVDLPGECSPDDEDTEYTLDPAWHLDVDVPLDASTTVVVDGFSCWDEPQTKVGSGVELRALFEALETDYTALIVPLLGQGMDDWEVAAQIAAQPSGGFVGEAEMCPHEVDRPAGLLRFVYDDAPAILLQIVSRDEGQPLAVTDIVHLQGVQYTNGHLMLHFYAGFLS